MRRSSASLRQFMAKLEESRVPAKLLLDRLLSIAPNQAVSHERYVAWLDSAASLLDIPQRYVRIRP